MGGKESKQAQQRQANAENAQAELRCGEPIEFRGHSDYLSDVAVSPDSERIAAIAEDATIIVWSARTHKRIIAIKSPAHAVRSVAWSPDGRRLVSGCYDRTARVWDAATGEQLRSFEFDTGIDRLCWHPAGRSFVACDF